MKIWAEILLMSVGSIPTLVCGDRLQPGLAPLSLLRAGSADLSIQIIDSPGEQ